jgi:alkyl sulfatase BDS1-like metallo-beta-lactamase superfamily hydrolase
MSQRKSMLELSEALWEGADALGEDLHPIHSRFPWGEEVADGVLVYKGTASANTVDTGDGLVMLDTGGQPDTRDLFSAVRGWRPAARLAAATYSHHHVDHVFGTKPFEEEASERHEARPLVYAHAKVSDNFDRYLRMAGWNISINVRQFGEGSIEFAMPSTFRYPDVVYSDALTFRQGALTFELHHAMGETEDATWTWVPERRLLHPGDLFIWSLPNAGNPQKVQRYVGAWAEALQEMAALGAEILLPGHGLPLLGAQRIHQALTDTAELLRTLEREVLLRMEQAMSLDEIIHDVQVPAHLGDKPYLRPVYDHPQFLVRNVWRQFGGWYEGDPDNLLPAPRSEQARELVRMAGGTQRVLARAAELSGEGNLRLACHLVELAALAQPESAEVHETRGEVYEKRAAAEQSSMARNILRHAAISSSRGLRDFLRAPAHRVPPEAAPQVDD